MAIVKTTWALVQNVRDLIARIKLGTGEVIDTMKGERSGDDSPAARATEEGGAGVINRTLEATDKEIEDQAKYGVYPDDVREWVGGKASETVTQAEKVRDAVTKYWTPVKIAVVGACVVAAASLASMANFIVHRRDNVEQVPVDPPATNAPSIAIPTPIPSFPPPQLDLTLSEDQFAAFIVALEIPSFAALGYERVDLPTSDIQRPVEFPAPLRAAADVPVEVEVSRNGQIFSGTTTVQQVYEALPQAREQLIEQAAQQPANRAGIEFKDIHVASEFHSITIRVP